MGTDCEHGLVRYAWDGDVQVTICVDCDAELGREFFPPERPQGTCRSCGQPAKNGERCRRCAIEEWRITR